MIRIGEIIDGRYEILKEIGRGGMSIVYLAMDNRLNKSIVVKEIRRRDNSNNKLLMDSLKQESDLLKNLDHAALPKIYDIIDRGDIYVVMDYIEGESLNRKLKREGKIQAKEVINYGIQLAKVLSYLHNRPTPIIYRDMKPDNVMLTPDGRIKLIDFGISKEYKVDTESDTTNLGTRAFAAPEQIAGLKTNARTDIYSLGVTLYNLVTGKSLNDPPFMLKPIREWDSSLPEGLEYIIKKCTETDPADRYENCDDLLYDLENVEKLTKAYKVKLIKEMSRFIVSSILLIFFIVITKGYAHAILPKTVCIAEHSLLFIHFRVVRPLEQVVYRNAEIIRELYECVVVRLSGFVLVARYAVLVHSEIHRELELRYLSFYPEFL